MTCVLRYGRSSRVHAEIIPDKGGWRIEMPDGRIYPVASLAEAQAHAIRLAQLRYPILRDPKFWRWESPDGRSHFPGLPDALGSPPVDLSAVPATPLAAEEENAPAGSAMPIPGQSPVPTLPGSFFHRRRTKGRTAAI